MKYFALFAVLIAVTLTGCDPVPGSNPISFSLKGEIDGVASVDATFKLQITRFDPNGVTVAVYVVDADGSFDIPGLIKGEYYTVEPIAVDSRNPNVVLDYNFNPPQIDVAVDLGDTLRVNFVDFELEN